MKKVVTPLTSLISKSQKAQEKLGPGTWQYAMLRDNLEALHIVVALLEQKGGARDFSTNNLQNALRALASMMEKTTQAQAKFPIGTSQHSLLKNRFQALRAGEEAIEHELIRREREDETANRTQNRTPREL